MKKLLTAMTAAWFLCTLPLTSYAAEKQLFPDVPPSKHFAESVNNLAERNIIGGYPDGKYGPNNPITRGQMASIIVKAFDLPRIWVLKHSFTDVSTNGRYSHDESILIIYELGITTGTTPTTFSPNANITRGQAAKLLKTAEENKPPMVTITASELCWQSMMIWQSDAVSIEGDGKDGLFRAIKVDGKAGYTEDRVQLVPLKEGKGVLNLQGVPVKGANVPDYKKYYVHIKKVKNELKLTLEETEDTLPTNVKLFGIDKEIKSIALSAMEGKLLNADVPFTVDPYKIVSFKLDKPGEYIVDVTLKDGKKLRYGAAAVQKKDQLYYETEAIQESPAASYTEKSSAFKKKYTIQEKDAADIAVITYDSKTNTFEARAAGKKGGTIHIDYGQTLTEKVCDELLECTDNWTGAVVNVRKIGSIVNVTIGKDLVIYH